MKTYSPLLLAALLLGCGDDGSQGSGSMGSAETFGDSTPVDDGYTRYYSSVQTLEPGESMNLVEWVAPALDRDMDILTVKGGQTVGGHHVLLAASSAIQKIGTVRDYGNEDQLTSTLVGGAGGEGEGTSFLPQPKGYVFRVHKGQGFYLQTHYINLTDATIDVRSYVDVQLAKPSEDHNVLALFANATLDATIPPASEFTYTNECVTQEDIELLFFANHMHEYGTSVRTEAVHPDGTVQVLKDDPVWNVDWQSTPNYTIAFDEPVRVPKGSTLRTTCTWNNTSDKELSFPDEMCVFSGHQEGEKVFSCTDGVWRVSTEGAEGDGAPAAAITQVGDGACVGEDLSKLPAVRATCEAKLRADVTGCALPLLQGDSQCVVDCFEENETSNSCGECYGAFMACNAANCAMKCSSGAQSEECLSCQQTNCCADFETCSGVSCG